MKKALLVIDVQNDYFPGGKFPLWNADTALEKTLSGLGATDLLVCGMMTQNCVTHTAISKSAEKYQVSILPDCCTTVDAMIHNIALHAVSTRLPLVNSDEAI